MPGKPDLDGQTTTNVTSLGVGSYRNPPTGGTRNTTLGNRTGESITTGSYNVAVGYFALGNITSGNQNTALGYAAGPDDDTVGDTTSLGYIAKAEAQRGIAIGSHADAGGVNSIAIGYSAVTQGDDAVAIGKGVIADAGEIVLGDSGHTVVIEGHLQTEDETGTARGPKIRFGTLVGSSLAIVIDGVTYHIAVT